MFDTSKLKGRIVEKYGSQTEFAKAIGRTKAFVSYVINGKSQLTQEDVVDWANALDIAYDELHIYFFATKRHV